MSTPPYITIAPEVEVALQDHDPIVALESSVIAQGLPQPANCEAAYTAEQSVRAAGAVPATLAIIDGRIHVGLDDAAFERLAASEGVEKAGARDLARGIASGATMATTVGASLAIARAVGIHVLATGGIGGVHRDAEQSGDISNDLEMLARTGLITVCAGAKSILDLHRTMEYLETLGVPVVGYQTTQLPAFYTRESEIHVPAVADVNRIVRMFTAQRALGLSAGIVVANPPPADLALDRAEVMALVERALAAAAREGVRGKDVTPYLLAFIAAQTSGRSVHLNIALLSSNARLAGEIAVALLRSET
jgi:pseudouridine-5'-phosphate glycosidase